MRGRAVRAALVLLVAALTVVLAAMNMAAGRGPSEPSRPTVLAASAPSLGPCAATGPSPPPAPATSRSPEPGAGLSVAPTATPSTTEVGSTVTFSAHPSGGTGVYTYRWGFGDGNGSTAASPTHVYEQAGVVSPWVNVSDSGGNWSNRTLAVTVHLALEVSATAAPAATDVGIPVEFEAVASRGVTPYGVYNWTFGDGATGGSPTPSHAYAAPGSYTAVVTVKDALGVSATASVAITVNATPTASVSASTTSPHTGTAVTFSVIASAGTPPFAVAWTFGDGATGTGATTAHAYASTGTYTVSVTLTDAAGASVTETVAVNVTNPTPGFSLGSLTSGTGLYVLGGVAAVAVLAVVAVLLRRRRRSERDEEPGEETDFLEAPPVPAKKGSPPPRASAARPPPRRP